MALHSLLFFIEQLLYGFLIGLNYSLMALGLSLIFGVMRIINFAHGELFMLGGYFFYFLITLLGFHPVPAFLITVVTLFLIGVVIERPLIRPLFIENLGDEYSIIITFGLSNFLVNFAIVAFGPEFRRPPRFAPVKVNLLIWAISGDKLYAALIASALIVLTYLFIRRTKTGIALQATAQDRIGAYIVGIDVFKMNGLAMGIAAALAGAAGAILTPVFLLYPMCGTIPGLKGFVIIVLGGMGSIEGSIISSIILGIIESLGSVYISAPYRDVYSFLVLVAVLLFRPQGLFGVRERRV